MTSNIIPIMSFDNFEDYISGFPLERIASNEAVYPPDLKDLFSLYTKVRTSKAIAILEIGSGWSTLILAKALDENRMSYSNEVIGKIRHPNPYTLMTVDCSLEFQAIALSRLTSLTTSQTKIIPIFSPSQMQVVNGQTCHLFDSIPPFTADFVYLDGPDCDQVGGAIHGMSVRFGDEHNTYGLPMSGDLILLEPYFWPGTLLVTDGRGANSYFLKRNFRRNWRFSYEMSTDQYLFYLDEEPWGNISAALLNFKNGLQ